VVGLSWPRILDAAGQRGPSDPDGTQWISSLRESGCAAGVNLLQTGPPDPEDNFVGSGGGYGGIYCFRAD
jgi:hypothetical protein